MHSMDVTGMQVIGALLTSLIVCAALGPVLIPILHKLKFGQSIRDVGPASHMKKSGTPTMGGIMMLCGLFFAMVVWNRFTPLIIIAFVLTFGHALIVIMWSSTQGHPARIYGSRGPLFLSIWAGCITYWSCFFWWEPRMR